MDIFYLDGEFIDGDQAKLPIKDLAFLRGFGVFDFLVTYNKVPFCLDEHVERLERSASLIGLTLNHSHDRICEIVMKTLEQNPDHDESNIRIVCSGGVSSDGITPEGNGSLVVMVTRKRPMPDSWYTKGAGIALVKIDRCLPAAKSTNYLSAVWGLQHAATYKAIEAVYLDPDNRVLEGTTSNIFGVKKEMVITPPDGILMGITRKKIIGLAATDFEIEERHFTKDELLAFDEVFLTSSNKEVAPVVEIDGQTVGNGKIGAVTRKMMERFKRMTESLSSVDSGSSESFEGQ